ncbi:hypothetical protein V3C99_019153, partial [Haemonchus contortus]|uniref:Conserved plasma membrane protein n=1 Tax=Haemonchus contortus TaxID=6289 RepID=A0A7I4Z2T5_HAECO
YRVIELESARYTLTPIIDAVMLSLLSLIIASGTVLRADTEQWEPTSYPDPRTNASQCNTVEDSTLCDPDRILTDTWRQTINDNIMKQTARLQNVDVQYTAEASGNCCGNNVTDVRIFVILARRINTTSNQNITSKDLTTFGHGLREAYGLDAQPCKNYILILGVELAKELYVWTGSDLAFPKERMDTSLSQYKNMFLERNYMEGLNKIVEEIGNILVDPFKDSSTVTSMNNATMDSDTEMSPENTTVSLEQNSSIPIWIYIIMITSTTVAIVSLLILFAVLWKKYEIRDILRDIYPNNKEEKPTYLAAEDVAATKPDPVKNELHNVSSIQELKEMPQEESSEDNASGPPSGTLTRKRYSVSEISLPRTVSLSGSNRLAFLQSADAYRLRTKDAHFPISPSDGSFV